MAITTEAGLIAAQAGGLNQPILKAAIANAAAGQIFSYYRSAGSFPLQPAIPTAHALCSNSTAGAITTPTLTGGNTSYINAVNAFFSVAAQIEIVDRVIHGGGLNGTLTTAQAVNTPALPIRAPAAGCRWWLEWYADTGATAVTANVAVTYTDATTSVVAIALSATTRANRKIEITPVAGKRIASVQTVTLSATTGAVGNFGVTVTQSTGIRFSSLTANAPIEYLSMMWQTPNDACLALIAYCTTTTAPALDGGLFAMQG
jgi:hypothetical protein